MRIINEFLNIFKMAYGECELALQLTHKHVNLSKRLQPN